MTSKTKLFLIENYAGVQATSLTQFKRALSEHSDPRPVRFCCVEYGQTTEYAEQCQQLYTVQQRDTSAALLHSIANDIVLTADSNLLSALEASTLYKERQSASFVGVASETATHETQVFAVVSGDTDDGETHCKAFVVAVSGASSALCDDEYAALVGETIKCDAVYECDDAAMQANVFITILKRLRIFA